MAVRNRRFTLAAVALPFLFLVMSGLVQAAPTNFILVTTLSGGSVSGACSLSDAIKAANTKSVPAGSTCAAGTGTDEIVFMVTGTIVLDAPLNISDADLVISGPPIGCSGTGPCGITIDGDENPAADGGIIFAETSTTLTLQNLAFTQGLAGEGGAVFADGTDLEIDDCLFYANVAEDEIGFHGGKGGAIYINSAGTVDILNSTFADNEAVNGTVAPTGSAGGAIADMNNSATLKITNSTIDGNSAGGGGGYAAMAKPFVKATLLASNTGGNCETVTPHDLGYNISSDASCGFSGTSLNSTSPGLASSIENNGGPTGTIALLAGSEAIGRDTDCTDQSGDPVLTDQRLYTRPDSPSKCDSGAYEFDGTEPLELVSGSERLQIVHSTGSMSDQINTAFTFIDNGPGASSTSCDDSNDAFDFLELFVVEGSCSALPDSGLLTTMSFTTATVNHETYGTDFFTVTGADGYTLSARMVALPPPAGACGEWTLNLELSKLSLAEFDLTGSGPGPFALILVDGDGNRGCFDIDNAIVGGAVDPPTRSVRRGVRR
jgi:hypothetical protein